jgi:O-antigen ligase
MVAQLFLVILFLTSIITIYRIQLGFALVVAWRLIIPPIARVDMGPLELSLNSWLTLMLLSVLMFNVIFRKNVTISSQNKFLVPSLKWLFIGLFIISIFSIQLTFGARVSSLIQTIYTEVSLALIAWYIFDNEKDFRALNTVLLLATLVICLYGFYCYLTLSNPLISLMNVLFVQDKDALGLMDEQRGGLAGRIQGTMSHPLTWGGACVLLFFYFLQNTKPIKVLFRIGIILMLLANVLFSGSRSALLALIVGLVYFVVISEYKVKVRIIKYGVIGFFVLVVSIYQIPALSKYQGFFESTVFFWDDSAQASTGIKGSTTQLRLTQLAGAFDMIKEAPLVGLGPGYIKYYSATFGVHPVMMGFESIVFSALVETGILGLILWGVFFLSLLKLIKKGKALFGKSELYNPKVLFIYCLAYILFIVFTGVQNTLYLFLVLYVIQLRGLRINTSNRFNVTHPR